MVCRQKVAAIMENTHEKIYSIDKSIYVLLIVVKNHTGDLFV